MAGQSLTVSGNEITDATRAAAAAWPKTQQGGSTDGAVVPGGVGVWEAATNLFRRGQCDATTDLSVNSAVSSIDATTPAPFSPQSVKVVTNGAVGNEGGACNTGTGQAVAAGTAVVGSVYFKGVAGQTYEATLAINNTDATTTIGAVLNFVATGAWQLVTPPSLLVSVGKTGDSFRVRVLTHTIRAETLWYAHAMLQKGVAVVSPYVATSGGATATRAASSLSLPASLIRAVTGWFAMRVRVGYTYPNTSSSWLGFLDWGGSDGNSLQCYISPGTSNITLRRVATGGTGTNAVTKNGVAKNAGDYMTIVCSWTPGALAISIDGAVFTTGVPDPSQTPTGLPSTFALGTRNGVANFMDSATAWFACGTGTLANADVAVLAALANHDPSFAALSAAAQITAAWPADTSAYEIPLVDQVAPVIA